MLRLVITLGILILSFGAFTQYDGEGENELSRFRPGFMWFYTGLRPGKPEKSRKYDRLIFDITYNDWVGTKQPFKNHWASIGLNTNLMFDIPLTKGNTVSFGWGVSHQLYNIRHNNFLFESEQFEGGLELYKDDSYHLEKSVLRGNSLSIPLEIRFRKKGWKHFKIHLGGKIGYQLNLMNKYVSRFNHNKEVYKNYGINSTEKIQYSVHARVGVRNWALFGSYNLNKILSDPYNNQLNLIQFGLSISLF